MLAACGNFDCGSAAGSSLRFSAFRCVSALTMGFFSQGCGLISNHVSATVPPAIRANTPVVPPFYLRSTSVPPGFYLRHAFGGRTEVERW